MSLHSAVARSKVMLVDAIKQEIWANAYETHESL